MIQIENLQFRWPKDQKDLINIPSWHVQDGASVFLRGPSGTGKSTLLNLIGGVLQPNSGSVSVMGENLTNLKPSAKDRFRANHIGFIFQTFNLIPYLSIQENILLACRFAPKRQERLVELSTTAKEESIRLMQALELPPADTPVTNLSIGQMQRVGVARALLGNPALVIADEPTSALDTKTRDHFIKLLQEQCQKQKATLLFVSHDTHLQNFFDHTVALQELNHASQ